jgi:hypothetical protein
VHGTRWHTRRTGPGDPPVVQRGRSRRCPDSFDRTLSLTLGNLSLGRHHRPRSKHLTGAAADNLRAATEFAAERGTPINCAISINWAMFSGFGVPDDVRLARAQERLRHRLERQGFELVWWWVREVSKGGIGAPNTQFSAHNPFVTVEEFERLLCECFEPEGGPNDAAIKVKFAFGPIGWWRYCCKGLSREEAKQRRVRAVYQGEIDGKRSGMTQNINRAARERWQTQRVAAARKDAA